MNATQELKSVTIELDENQMCVLHTIVSVYFSDHPISKTRSDMNEIRRMINDATREAIA